MYSPKETTLTVEKLHWGIITPAISVTVALFVVTLPFLLFFKFSQTMFGQLNSQATGSAPWIYWLILVPDLLVFAAALLVTWIAYRTSEITVTDARVIHRTGFISRSSGELPLENVEGIFVDESLFGRLLGYGTVTLTSVGGQTFPFHYLRTPQRFYAIVQDAVKHAKMPVKPGSKSSEDRVSPPSHDDSRYMPKG